MWWIKDRGASSGRGSHSASRGGSELNTNWDVWWRSDSFPSDFTDCTYSEAAQQWAMQQQPGGLPSCSTDRDPQWLWASADLPDRAAPLLCQIYTQNTSTFTAAQLHVQQASDDITSMTRWTNVLVHPLFLLFDLRALYVSVSDFKLEMMIKNTFCSVVTFLICLPNTQMSVNLVILTFRKLSESPS